MSQERYVKPDWFLRILVDLVNDQKSEIGVTLCVRGAIITGKMVNGREYFLTLGQQFADALRLDEELRAQMFRSAAEQYYPDPKDAASVVTATTPEPSTQPDDEVDDVRDDDEGPFEERNPTMFVHLKDARIVHGSSLSGLRPGVPSLWRGRLGSIDGFTLGEIRSSADEE